MVQLDQQAYASYIAQHYHRTSEGVITDFMTRHNGHLYFGDRINLSDLVRRYGTPLEVAYNPLITERIRSMQNWARQARSAAQYTGSFIYAYATKANFAADVIQTALAAGAHYETSAAADVRIAQHLWRQGILPGDRLICCNGSKEPAYIEAICDLRIDDYTNIVPIVDDLEELDALMECPAPFQLGVRERAAGNRDGFHPGNDRFGLTMAEIDAVVERLQSTRHRLTVYHAMIGSQVEDREHFLTTLRESIVAYCRLRQRAPELRYFNFGGGMPTSGYRLDFQFDYAHFLTELMSEVRAICADFSVPMPDLIGEFGRYTVATHSLYLFEVGKVKAGQPGEPDWHLINGSLMVSLPDSLLVEDQEFVVLPLDNWDAPVRPVRLAGRRTCDSDDVYPRFRQQPLMLPAGGPGQVIAICGIGAYQQMISGRGGAHHCLSPEPHRVVITDVEGRLVTRSIPQQDQASIMRLLGYQPHHLPYPLPLAHPKSPSEPARISSVQRPMSLVAGGSVPRRRNRDRLRLVRSK